MSHQIQPPRWADKFLTWFCSEKVLETLQGDLYELYAKRCAENGKFKANLYFVRDVLDVCRPFAIRTSGPISHIGIYKSYFTVALRSILRNKGYSFINIAGLAIGMAATMLILLWVQSEVEVDRFHEKTDHIYQMFSREEINGAVDVWGNTPALMAPEFLQSFPEVEEAVRYRNVFFLTKVNDNRFNLAGAFADPGFLSMFTFPLLKGGKSALNDVSGIVLTKKMAISLFGRVDCLGSTVIVNDGDNFKVTGVLDDLPVQTEFSFAYLLPWSYMTKLGWDANQTWSSTNARTYVLLKNGASQALFDEKVRLMVTKHVPKGDGSAREVFSHALSKVHLYTSAQNGQLTGGRIETVRLFTVIAALILIIACINFMNLSTARSEKRGREVGIRKISGARSSSLILQFLVESTVLAFVSFICALVFVPLVLSSFNKIVGVQLSLEWGNPAFWLFSLFFILLTGLLAGSYPAFYLSSSHPLKVLKGASGKVRDLLTPRKVLVVVQFTFAIAMIICTMTVQRQIRYTQGRDAGYNREDLAFNFTQGEVLPHFDLIKKDLLASGAVTSVTRAFSPVTRIWGIMTGLRWQGSTEEDKRINFQQFGVDMDFTKTMGVHVLQGREIDIDKFPADSSAIMLNEAALNIMRLQDPVGEVVRDEQGEIWHIVGIIKDFIIESPYEKVKPMIVQGWSNRYGTIHFRLNPANERDDNLVKAERVFRKHNPEYPFEYNFADEIYERKFGSEHQTRTLIALFSVLTIFISCLGLFGLAAYMAEQRTKEIALRKVLGASVLSLWGMLTKNFIGLMIVSLCIASPIAWYFMHDWLMHFEYRTEMAWWIFAVAGLGALLITLLTVSYQSIKAALSNPVESLKSE